MAKIDKVKDVYHFMIKKVLWKFIILWLIWDLLGFRFIWSKARPPIDNYTQKRPPSTIFIWIIGVYVAFFGVASQRYENRIDIIENRANAIFAQLSSAASNKALSRLSRIQNMKCPQNPKILHPVSIFRSLFGEECEYDEMVKLVKEAIENWKHSLEGVNLSYAHLEGTQLKKANLKGANLKGANLKGANLEGAELQGANIKDAIFDNAWLRNANLEVVLHIIGGGPECAETEQLSKAKTLYDAELPYALLKQMKRRYPCLFKDPLPPPSAIRVRVLD